MNIHTYVWMHRWAQIEPFFVFRHRKAHLLIGCEDLEREREREKEKREEREYALYPLTL
jgi:hypothetical protein